MISPELLRRYPFFGFLDDAQLKAVAMLTEELVVEKNATLFENDQPANALYLLIEGCLDLNYIVIDRLDPKVRKEFYVGDVNPGEICGISALIEPYVYTSAVRATCSSRVLRIEASGLRALSELDVKLQAGLMKATARAAMERLHDTRVQLAAARA
jgi:CRP-like cAMP-binding protein